MKESEATGADAVGHNVRLARAVKGINLRELARRINVSPSLISQIETGKVRPSVRTLFAIASELGVPIDDLLAWNRGKERPAARESNGSMAPQLIQRRDERKSIVLEGGVRWERLTPAADEYLEFIFVTYEVGGSSSAGSRAMTSHSGREYGVVIDGRLGVSINFEDYDLGPGDSIVFESSSPHRFWNAGDTPVHTVWVDLRATR